MSNIICNRWVFNVIFSWRLQEHCLILTYHLLLVILFAITYLEYRTLSYVFKIINIFQFIFITHIVIIRWHLLICVKIASVHWICCLLVSIVNPISSIWNSIFLIIFWIVKYIAIILALWSLLLFLFLLLFSIDLTPILWNWQWYLLIFVYLFLSILQHFLKTLHLISFSLTIVFVLFSS